jgi:hypothetical protein
MYCLFWVVLCIVCVQMCTVLLPPGGYPIAVKKCTSYHIIIFLSYTPVTKCCPKYMHHAITNLVADFKLNFQVSRTDISHMIMFFFVTLWTTMLVPAFRGNILSLYSKLQTYRQHFLLKSQDKQITPHEATTPKIIVSFYFVICRLQLRTSKPTNTLF